MKTTVYERVAMLCRLQGMSIRELEEKAGIGNGVVGKWRTKSPTLDSLEKVAKALRVPVITLIGKE